MPAKKKTTKKTATKKTATARPVAKPMDQPRKKDRTLAIVGLVVNVVLLPGLGTLIGGDTKTGIIQLILVIVGVILTLTFIGAIIGIPLSIVAWVWALVSSINQLRRA